MKAIILPVCFLGLLAVANAEDLRPQIKAMGDAVCKTMMAKDMAGFTATMKTQVTPSFKYYDFVGAKPMSFDQMVAEMKMGFATYDKMLLVETRLDSIKTVGDTTTVVSSHTMKAKTVPDKDKKPHLMVMTGISIDVFKKVGGSLKMDSMTWKSMHVSKDGATVKMPKM